MVRWLLASLALPLVGCGWLVSVDGLTGGDAGADGPEPCPMDLTSNPRHCGACNHSCLGGACVASRCRPVTIAENQPSPRGIDVSARHVYWVNRSPAGLMSWNKDGSGGRPLATPSDQLDDPFDVAADAEERFIYWSELKNARIYRKPLEGGERQAVGMGGPGQAAFLAIEGSQIYVSDHRPNFGSIATEKVVLYSGADIIGGLAVRAGLLYWAEQMSGRILALPVAGAPMATAVVEGAVAPMGVAADDQDLFWFEEGQRLRRAPRRGGAAPVTVYEAPQPFLEADVAVDATAIYWTEHYANSPGVVRRLAR